MLVAGLGAVVHHVVQAGGVGWAGVQPDLPGRGGSQGLGEGGGQWAIARLSAVISDGLNPVTSNDDGRLRSCYPVRE